MSTVTYVAVAHVVVYGAVALVLYGGLRQSVLRGRVTPFAACVAYLLALALLPSLFMQALAALANHLFSSGLVFPEAAWDVGLAMSLVVSTWACYTVGVVAACLASWSFVKNSANAT